MTSSRGIVDSGEVNKTRGLHGKPVRALSIGGIIMSFKEAKNDNIRVGKDRNGFNVYFPHCRICGHEVTSWSYLPGKEYTCQACKAIHRLAKKS